MPDGLPSLARERRYWILAGAVGRGSSRPGRCSARAAGASVGRSQLARNSPRDGTVVGVGVPSHPIALREVSRSVSVNALSSPFEAGKVRPLWLPACARSVAHFGLACYSYGRWEFPFKESKEKVKIGDRVYVKVAAALQE